MTIYQTKMFYGNGDVDATDGLRSKDRATNWDITGFVISIVSHLVDVGFDINLAYTYYSNEETYYFLATLAFILVPALINTAFSIRMYYLDQGKKPKTTLTKKFTKKRLCCIMVLIFQLAPVLRYFDALQYAIKSKKAEKAKDIQNQRKYYELMVKEDSDVALLRVLECFLEAAPQQILQLAIIFHTYRIGTNDRLTSFHQLLSIGSSFVSMAWSMASYQRLLRVSLVNKNNISWSGTIVQFMWHFLVTVSRIMCISVVASILPGYTILVLITHWLIMVAWLHFSNQESDFCNHNKIYNLFFYCIFGMVYIFTHVSLNEGKTFCKYVFFYLLLCAENVAATVIWIVNVENELKDKLYYQPIIYINSLSFFLGIGFMILYYKIFHPSTGYKHRQQNVPS